MKTTGNSQFHGVVIVLIIAILMSVFWRYFSKNQENMVKANLANISGQLSSRLSLIHAQWLVTGKPSLVKVRAAYTDDDSAGDMKVRVNKFGWPDSKLDFLACERIWKSVMERELIAMNEPMFVIEVKSQSKKSARTCRFMLNDRLYIEYHSLNGKVFNKTN
ncbi:hypothetical protein [Thalassotalea crassostreae]|uniref:hypothetical protein n=1 Tax=Thalassotalea crassostreae TaxID=1763536 RepID=UPI000839839E|nr:hypothetical protein [Thalassotalea crassostreae]